MLSLLLRLLLYLKKVLTTLTTQVGVVFFLCCATTADDTDNKLVVAQNAVFDTTTEDGPALYPVTPNSIKSLRIRRVTSRLFSRTTQSHHHHLAFYFPVLGTTLKKMSTSNFSHRIKLATRLLPENVCAKNAHVQCISLKAISSS